LSGANEFRGNWHAPCYSFFQAGFAPLSEREIVETKIWEAKDSNFGIQQVNTSANELAKMAAQIQERVGRFKVSAAVP